MKIQINFEKKHIYMLSALILLFGALFVYAANVEELQGWRPLSQISKSWSDQTSVDENNDGIIDLAEAVQGQISCQWYDMNVGSSGDPSDCNSNNCRAFISLVTALDNGFTGSCYFQNSNDKYYIGYLETYDPDTFDNVNLRCRDVGRKSTSSREVKVGTRAKYYGCKEQS